MRSIPPVTSRAPLLPLNQHHLLPVLTPTLSEALQDSPDSKIRTLSFTRPRSSVPTNLTESVFLRSHPHFFSPLLFSSAFLSSGTPPPPIQREFLRVAPLHPDPPASFDRGLSRQSPASLVSPPPTLETLPPSRFVLTDYVPVSRKA